MGRTAGSGSWYTKLTVLAAFVLQPTRSDNDNFLLRPFLYLMQQDAKDTLGLMGDYVIAYKLRNPTISDASC